MATLQDTYNSCLFHTATALGRSLIKLADQQFAPIGLTSSMGFILMTAKTASGILIADLALVHQLDISTVSRALDKLAQAELIKREGQRKNIRIFITPKGELKEADARSAWAKVQQAYASVLSAPGALDLAHRVSEADAKLRAAHPKRRRRAVSSSTNP